MRVRVRYLASLRERLGRERAVVEAPEAERLTVAEVWERSAGQGPLPAGVLCAVNMEYATPEQEVRDGDEVAFFPPVTGGAPGRGGPARARRRWRSPRPRAPGHGPRRPHGG